MNNTIWCTEEIASITKDMSYADYLSTRTSKNAPVTENGYKTLSLFFTLEMLEEDIKLRNLGEYE